jgi:phage baseplate assembly protein W
MSDIQPQLPLTLDETNGAYTAIQNIKDNVKQNFKNLILTSPGERIMETGFGVGLRNFLFENGTLATEGEIQGRINSQVAIYLPYIELNSVGVFTRTTTGNLISAYEQIAPNILVVRVVYRITSLNESDVLDIIMK